MVLGGSGLWGHIGLDGIGVMGSACKQAASNFKMTSIPRSFSSHCHLPGSYTHSMGQPVLKRFWKTQFRSNVAKQIQR